MRGSQEAQPARLWVEGSAFKHDVLDQEFNMPA